MIISWYYSINMEKDWMFWFIFTCMQHLIRTSNCFFDICSYLPCSTRNITEEEEVIIVTNTNPHRVLWKIYLYISVCMILHHLRFSFWDKKLVLATEHFWFFWRRVYLRSESSSCDLNLTLEKQLDVGFTWRVFSCRLDYHPSHSALIEVVTRDIFILIGLILW